MLGCDADGKRKGMRGREEGEGECKKNSRNLSLRSFVLIAAAAPHVASALFVHHGAASLAVPLPPLLSLAAKKRIN